jgi:poly-gamma-glutamate synthesis protein (capsule biosynthesis protein)
MTTATLLLCGDVMTGRGIDQILPCPVDPRIHEDYVRDAREYVRLAEDVSGPIPRGVDARYVWGDALGVLDQATTDARIINLETSVTSGDEYWKGKGINYRMHPANVPVLAALRPDVCVLANNHVLDYGPAGLLETLNTLHEHGLRTAGAGRNVEEAARPAEIELAGGPRLLVVGVGVATSGIPREWAATRDRPGVHYLPDLSADSATALCEHLSRARHGGSLTVVSIHWGSNWGYEVPDEQVAFAHRLVDAGAALVHGHSSHHVRPIEVYRNHLILHGCGDFLTDYEGIGQRPGFRDDLALMYLAALDCGTGALAALTMIPLQIRRFRLNHASPADTRWLRDTVDLISKRFGTRIIDAGTGRFTLEWSRST